MFQAMATMIHSATLSAMPTVISAGARSNIAQSAMNMMVRTGAMLRGQTMHSASTASPSTASSG